MATILEAEQRRGSMEEDGEKSVKEVEENGDDKEIRDPDAQNDNGGTSEANKSASKSKKGRPPLKKKPKKSKKLTDLDLDNATESDTDEYRASSDEEAVEEEEEISTDEYVPSDEERRR
jgi:hypothetical protein